MLRTRYPRVIAPLRKVATLLARVAQTYGLLELAPVAASEGGFSVNHVGLVVPNIEDFLLANDVLYRNFQRTEAVLNARQGVREVFITDGRTVIELLEPAGDTSPLRGFLTKNSGGGLVHICFECDDIEEGVALVQAAGGRLITGPIPDVAFDERPIAFMILADQVIELVERAASGGPS